MQVLIMTGLTLPEVSSVQLARIRTVLGADDVVTVARTPAEALVAAPQAHIILGRLDEELFATTERLRWVHAATSGVDAFLFPDFRESEVVLTGEKGLVGGHLADHAFALLLALSRRLGPALRLGPAAWEQRITLREQSLELSGLEMGIIGFGGTGREVARRAAAFGMHCRAADRDAVPGTPEAPLVHPLSHLPQLLEQSDVVTVCCPLTEETAGMIGAAELERMKPSALLINITRGAIIDGEALVQALADGKIAGAGLDVTPQEPLAPDHALWRLDNVVITPHTAGASQLRADRNMDRFVENLRRFQRGQPLIGLIDKALGY